MTDRFKRWLQQETGNLCAGTLKKTNRNALDVQELADFIQVLSQNLGLTPEMVRANLQFWAITGVGYDARTAAEWLTALRVLKDEVAIRMTRDFSDADSLRFWRAMDEVFTTAFIEVTHLASDLDRTEIVERMVELRRKMSQLEQTKSQFVTVSAHELRTPLTIIEGYAKMMRSVTSSEDRIRIFVDGLDNGIRRMHEIIEDIIDVSLIDLNAFELNIQEMYLEKIIMIVADNLSRHFQDRLVELVLMPVEELGPIYGDPEKLQQAFVKLLENALKFTPEGGRVTISLERVRPGEASEEIDGFVDVCISDTGLGIDSEDVDRIFEKFTSTLDTNLHSSSKTNFMGGGPGLGLPIARGIVELHGGRIWVESLGTAEKVYPGSTFHVELPLRRVKPSGEV